MSARPAPPSPRRLTTEVLVIGAGPTGLMAAAWCAKLGLQALVVDGKAGPTRESRALALQARSLEVYRQLGLDAEVTAGAPGAAALSPGYRARPLGTVHLDRVGHALTPFPGITVFEQSANEELLARHLADQHRAVAWGTSFRRFAPADEDGPDGGAVPAGQGAVTVDLDSARGPLRVTAQYVIAADGASSPVGGALGIPFEGSTNPFEFYVLDAHGVTGTAAGITLRVSRDHFMLAFPLGDDGRGGQRVRLLGILRAQDRDADAGPEADSSEAPVHATRQADARDEERARASLSEEFGIRYAGTEWYSRYRVHHRVARRFRSGRVFLAGDAAHIHSPVGAQGMNTGLQDAQNIACAIADVLAGRAPQRSLDRYEAERRPVALTLVRTTDRVFAAVTSDSALARLLRARLFPALAPLVLRRIPRSGAGGRLFGYLSQIRIHYWMPGTDEARASRRWNRRGRVLGRRLPWVPDAGLADAGLADAGLPDAGPTGPRSGADPQSETTRPASIRPESVRDPRGDNHASLTEAVWQVHAYGPAAAGPAAQLAERHRELGRHRPDTRAGTSAAGGPDAAGAGPASGMGPGVPIRAYQAAPEAGLPDGTALLVRPDGFVAAMLQAGG